jgi:acetylornithine deacetylase
VTSEPDATPQSGMSGEPVLDAAKRAARDVVPAIIERLRAGVRTPSINPSVQQGPGEGAFQEFVAAELERLGCRVEIWEPDADALAAWYPRQREIPRPNGFKGRPNVIAWVPSDEPPDGRRAHVILNSHADTVAPGDAASWGHPPFDAVMADDRLHGLGSSDAKGSLFAMIGAVAALREAGIKLNRSVMLQSVVDEEFGGAGALECVRRGYSATAAIIGEPTELRVCPGSRGSTNLHLRVFGRGAHPGEGWRGVNAIRMAWHYLAALDRLRDHLDRTNTHALWASLPHAHVWNLMSVHGRSSTTIARSVPDVCEVLYGVGLIGEERAATMRPVVEAALRAVTETDPWLAAHPPDITWLPGGFEPAVIDRAHPAVAALAAAVGGATANGTAVVEALSGATDGRHLVNEGNIPAINFGPGEMHVAHSPHESLRLDDFRRAVEALAVFLVGYCGVSDGGDR